MNELYENIRQIALDHGYTLGSLCDKAGVHRARLTDLKSGKVKALSVGTIQKLANVLGVSPDRLLGGEGSTTILHVDFSKERPDYELICAQLGDEQLMELLDALAAELRRRRERAAEKNGGRAIEWK